jgi:hypothetical protein
MRTLLRRALVLVVLAAPAVSAAFTARCHAYIKLEFSAQTMVEVERSQGQCTAFVASWLAVAPETVRSGPVRYAVSDKSAVSQSFSVDGAATAPTMAVAIRYCQDLSYVFEQSCLLSNFTNGLVASLAQAGMMPGLTNRTLFLVATSSGGVRGRAADDEEFDGVVPTPAPAGVNGMIESKEQPIDIGFIVTLVIGAVVLAFVVGVRCIVCWRRHQFRLRRWMRCGEMTDAEAAHLERKKLRAEKRRLAKQQGEEDFLAGKTTNYRDDEDEDGEDGEEQEEEVRLNVKPTHVANPMGSNFVPTPSFDGFRPGWAFKKGPKGVGYYQDEPKEPEMTTVRKRKCRQCKAKFSAEPGQKTCKKCKAKLVEEDSNPCVDCARPFISRSGNNIKCPDCRKAHGTKIACASCQKQFFSASGKSQQCIECRKSGVPMKDAQVDDGDFDDGDGGQFHEDEAAFGDDNNDDEFDNDAFDDDDEEEGDAEQEPDQPAPAPAPPTPAPAPARAAPRSLRMLSRRKEEEAVPAPVAAVEESEGEEPGQPTSEDSDDDDDGQDEFEEMELPSGLPDTPVAEPARQPRKVSNLFARKKSSAQEPADAPRKGSMQAAAPRKSSMQVPTGSQPRKGSVMMPAVPEHARKMSAMMAPVGGDALAAALTGNGALVARDSMLV